MKYQQEFLATFQLDAEPLLKEHWLEVALNQDEIRLNPDWDAYNRLEEQGNLKIFTARDTDDSLVGYFVVIVSRNIHYKDHLFAGNDVIFVDRSHRKSSVGTDLIRFAERCLREDGVSVLTINMKVHRPFDGLLSLLGFSNIERVYSKYLG